MAETPEPKVPTDLPNPFFEAWARVVVRYRWLALLLTVLTVAGSAWLAKTRIRVDTTIEAFAANDSDSARTLDEYRDEFGRDDMYLVMVEGDVFSLEYLTRLKALHDELANLDVPLTTLGQRRRVTSLDAVETQAADASAANERAGVDDGTDEGDDWGESDDEGWGDEAGGSIVEQITSLINVRRTRSKPDGIEVGELMDPFPKAADLAALEAEVLGDSTLVGQVVGKAGTHSAIAIRTQFMSEKDAIKVYAAVEAIIAKHQAPGFSLLLSGLPALNHGLNTLLMKDMSRMGLICIVLMLLTLIVLFRHPLGVIPPVLVVAFAAVNTAAVMAAVDMPMTMLTNILPAFLFCVGIGDSVHLISVYRDHMQAGMTSEEAVITTVSTTGIPVLYTTLTTMVGLLSFHFASLEAIQQMGTAGAIGVFMALLHSLILLPALLSFNKKSLLGARKDRKRDLIDRVIDWCRDLSGVAIDDGTGPEPALARTRRRRTLLGGAVLTGAAVYAISLIVVWHNPMGWMPDGTPTKVAFESMDTNIGGTANVQLLIDGPKGKGMKDLALMKGLEQLQVHIDKYEDPLVGPIVGNSIGLLDVVKETNRALHGGDQAFYRIPDTDRGVADALFMFENAGPDQLRQIATTDLSRSQMSIRIKWLEATAYRGLTKYIDEGIAKYIPDGSRVRPTGSVYTLVSTVSRVIGDLISSFSMAFIFITLIMMLLLRGLKLGLIAMVPNLMPIALIMGLMGAVGIPVDMNNLLIASISIGIAVDDTIHLLHHFRIAHLATGNTERAIRMALNHSGRAMISTSLILMLGFFAYMGATMYNIQRFGLLVGLTAGMALAVDLILGPALLRTFYGRAKASQGEA